MDTTRRCFLAHLPAAAAAVAVGSRTAWALPLDQERASRVLPRRDDGLPVVPDGELGPEFWRALRGDFLLPADEAFFNTGTLGASPRVVVETVTEHMTHVNRDVAHWDYRAGNEEYITGYFQEDWLREKIAAAVHADYDEIALTPNATVAMNYVANGVELGLGDEVLYLDASHSGARAGWELKDRRYGVHARPVKVPVPPEDPEQIVELFEDATTPRTRVWTFPHLTSGTAILFPVVELCRRARARGILTVVDGAQTFGHLPVDVRAMGCDAYFTSPHKWLLAPAGSGFLYVRREVLETMWPTIASGNHSNYEDGGFRLMQIGTGNLSMLKGLGKALDFFANLGQERVTRRILGLAERLRSGLEQIPAARILSPTHPAMRTATTIWTIEGVPGHEIQDALWESRVRVRAMGDRGVRQCCHVYNLEDEVDRTLEVARRLRAG